MNTFNIPHYYPSPNEVELEVLNEGSFAINHMELFESESNTSNDESDSDNGYDVAGCIRAVVEPLLVSHFGEAIIEEIFSRYKKFLIDQISKERMNSINVTISLTRKS